MQLVAPQTLLSLNLFLSIYLCLMWTAQIINIDNLNLIFLSFNLYSSCLSALSGHLGNLHHYLFSAALYLPLLTLFLAWYPLLPQDLWQTLFCLSVCLSSGHWVHQCVARWQRLGLDGRHLQPMVNCGWHWGGEEECLREKHVCHLSFYNIISLMIILMAALCLVCLWKLFIFNIC